MNLRRWLLGLKVHKLLGLLAVTLDAPVVTQISRLARGSQVRWGIWGCYFLLRAILFERENQLFGV